MTESEWLKDGDLGRMLGFLQGWAGDRKFRLFACACCRRIGPLLPNDECRRAVEIAEQFADGLVVTGDLEAAHQAASREGETEAGKAVLYATQVGLAYAGWDAAWYVAWYAAQAAVGRGADAIAWEGERRTQAALLREIVGNPFQQAFPPKRWPPELVLLARKVYAGQMPSVALADPLLELGFADWAAHFDQGEHPKGCWLLDLILKGKPASRRGRRRWTRSRRAG